MKRKTAVLLSFLLLICMIFPSCADTVEGIVTSSSDTEESKQKDPHSSDGITYGDETVPSVYITTNNKFQVTSKDVYTQCTIRFENNERFSVYESTYTDSDGGGAQIRCRGNMTYRIEDMKAKNKYSYKIKLDEKADIFGMGKSRHYVLVNSWRDPSYQRNKISYDYSAMLGLVKVKTEWVSVYYNGEYRGMYLFGETVRVEEGRVEIFSWEDFAEDMAERYAEEHGYDGEKTAALRDDMKDDLEWITSQKHTFKYGVKTETLDLSKYYDVEDLDLTSGYLIESCQGAIGSETVNWKTAHNVPISVDAPSRLTNTYMLDYVKTLIKDFEEALFSPTFYNSKGKHYSEYVDVDSMVDYWMVWNFFLNNEFSQRSLFFYIEDGKITWGPCWDFDQTMGSVMTVPEKWAEPNYWLEDRLNAWWLEIFGDPWFTSLCQERWFEMRELTDVFIQTYDIYYSYIKEEAARGYEYDGERYLKVNRPNVNNGHSFTPAEDYVFIKTWLKKRVAWLDKNFAKIDPNIDSGGNKRSTNMTAKVKSGSVELEPDKITVYGVSADYLIPTTATGTLDLSVTTSLSGVSYCDAYLNGSTKLKTRSLSQSTEAKYTIDISSLDMSEGALNVIYIIAYKSNGSVKGITSVYIRVSDIPNPDESEYVVEFGDQKMIVQKGSTITVPDVPYEREGYVFCGWTTSYESPKVYKPGDSYTAKGNISFYARFVPTDMGSQFVLDEYTPKS